MKKACSSKKVFKDKIYLFKKLIRQKGEMEYAKEQHT